jgi:hypothetical protein
MTETEWLESSSPTLMLEFLQGRVSDRRLRLFICACFRRIENWDIDDRLRKAVEISERCADGHLTFEESFELGRELQLDDDSKLLNSLIQRTGKSWDFWHGVLFRGSLITGWLDAQQADRIVEGIQWAIALQSFPHHDFDVYDDNFDEFEKATNPTRMVEGKVQAEILRDISGNPFHPAVSNTSWLSPAVEKLAESIYAEHAFHLMPDLADALEDAGCHETTILNHFRNEETHVRGCWGLDLLLAR